MVLIPFAIAVAVLWMVFRHAPGTRLTYLFQVVLRLAWSFTIGIPFFVLGILAFIVLDILFPEGSYGYVVLNKMAKWGSCYWFRGIKLDFQTDDFEVAVEKQRKTK
jgi:hypothetical protein